MTASYNDKLVLTPYKQGQGLTAEVKSGFASVKQRQTIVELHLLVDAHLNSGVVIPAGSSVFFDEEILVSPTSSAKFPKKAAFTEQEFIVMDFKQALAVSDEQ